MPRASAPSLAAETLAIAAPGSKRGRGPRHATCPVLAPDALQACRTLPLIHGVIVMDHSFALGGLLPLWVLGVPLGAGLIALIATPKQPRHTESRGPMRSAGASSTPDEEASTLDG